MKRNTIKGKLLLLVLVSTFLSFTILGVYNTVQSYSAEDKLVKKSNIDLAKETARYIDSYLQSKVAVIEAVAQEMPQTDLNVNNKNIVEKLLLGKKAGGFVDLYIGYEDTGDFLLSDGSYLNISKDNFDARKRPWYVQAVKMNEAGVTEPYVDITTKKLVVTVFTPLKQNGKLIGVVGSDIFIDTVVQTILNISLDAEGLAYIVDHSGKIIIHKDEKAINQKDQILPQIKENESFGFGEAIENNIPRLAAYGNIDTSDWKIIVNLDKESVFEEINAIIIKEIGLYLLLLIIILSLLFFSLTKLLAPLTTLQEGFNFFFRYLKNEETTISQIEINTNDEFGNMAKVINAEMKIVEQNINQDREFINEVKQIINKIKEGHLNHTITRTTNTDSLNELKDLLNEMLNNLRINIGNDVNVLLNTLSHYSKLDFRQNIPNAQGKIELAVNDLSQIINDMLRENKQNGLTLDRSSDILLENVETLNRNSTETAAALEETAAALEEITSTIVSNTENIAKMSSYSKDVSNSVGVGQELATLTVKSMDEINEQTQAIADAITVIDQIAFQTNILSLNAAVEAATAGEAGKGFAVVAQEVRNLASRSAEAAKEIKELVENATLKTNAGKDSADKMIKGYHSLNESILKTTNIIGQIAEAAQEQRAGIEQINDAVNQLDKQTQENVAISNTTHYVAEQTDEIAKLVVSSANEKEFIGKESIKAKDINQSNDKKFELIKKDNSKPSKIGNNNDKSTKNGNKQVIVPNNTNDGDWESF